VIWMNPSPPMPQEALGFTSSCCGNVSGHGEKSGYSSGVEGVGSRTLLPLKGDEVGLVGCLLSSTIGIATFSIGSDY